MNKITFGSTGFACTLALPRKPVTHGVRKPIMKKTISIQFFLCALFIQIICLANSSATEIEKANDLVIQGINLSTAEAQKLEDELRSNKNSLEIRTKLLGYYYTRSLHSLSAHNSRLRHIVWIIINHPDSEIAGLAYVHLLPNPKPHDYELLKKTWLVQIVSHKNNAKVLSNAASFFINHDSNTAEEYFLKAQSFDSDNYYLSLQLAGLYKLNVINATSHVYKIRNQRKTLGELEKTLHSMSAEKQKFYIIAGAANAAFETNELKKAKQYSLQLLAMAHKFEKDPYYGTAIHIGNIILGRIALKLSNIENAKSLLSKAAKAPTFPQIKIFGPNMSLALDLIEQGERKAVIEYLNSCKQIWKENIIDEWIKEIDRGRTPEQMKIMRNKYYY